MSSLQLSNGAIRNAFYKRTRKGKVVRIVQEKYPRTDLGFGYLHGNMISIDQLRAVVEHAEHKTLVLIDTNIALQQIDLLEQNCPALGVVIITQTVLQELRNLNLSVFRRLQSVLKDQSKTFIFFPNEVDSGTICSRQSQETANDYNDRAIVEACSFYKNALPEDTSLLFLTEDKANKARAISQEISTVDINEFVRQYSAIYPHLSDIVGNRFSVVPVGSDQKYSEYLSTEEVLSGIRSGKYVKGIIRCKNSWSECYVVYFTVVGKERRSVEISGELNVNRALDGDTVAIEILNSTKSVTSPKQNESGEIETDFYEEEGIRADELLQGKVVGVLKRNSKYLAGSINADETYSSSLNSEESTVLFHPLDLKYPKVWITTRKIKEISHQRLLVTIDSWPVSSDHPCGHYVQILGEVGNKDVETKIILNEYGVATEAFTLEVLSCLPPADWKITEEVTKDRRDFRGVPVVSIDPPGCKDIDDALHCIRLPNGRFEVGVHIADVTNFVHPNSPLDKEAARRSTSTYLVEKRLDMLPSLLTTELCSLRSSEDHLAFSVTWEMDESANIYDVQFHKSVIRSVASLTYDQAQQMLDDSEDNSVVATSVKNLNLLARLLRKARIDNGALTLASPEIRFKLDQETQNPTDVAQYNLKEANALVEEWMLLANITVSKKVLKHFPTLAVLRRHQPPTRDQFAPLLAAASAAGVSLDITTSKTLADSLDSAIREDDPFFNKLLRILSTRCMMPAQYFCSGEIPKDQWHHYGLATQVYTHFTSPIRRYADVLVHRLLAAAIGAQPLPAANADRGKQQDLCAHMNRRHRAAQYAQRASVNLYTNIYFKGKNVIEDGYVLHITSEHIQVLIPRFGIEHKLTYASIQKTIGSDSVEANCDEFFVLFNSNSKTLLKLSVLQKIQVEVTATMENGIELHWVQ